jgi:hypothetical protein
MENNKDEITNKTLSTDIHGTEIFELGYLINVILDYYEPQEKEEGEEWKKGTELERDSIPKSIDNLVQKAFETQLKKFTK